MGNLPILFSGALLDPYLFFSHPPFPRLPGEMIRRMPYGPPDAEVSAREAPYANGGADGLAGAGAGGDRSRWSGAADDAKVKAACREFERIFVAELMKQVLRPAIRGALSFQAAEGGPRGGTTILAELVVEGFSKEMAGNLDIGLAEAVYNAVSGRERVQTADGGNELERGAEGRRQD